MYEKYVMSSSIIKFLSDVRANNSREWFNANKNEYFEAKDEFVKMVDFLIPSLAVNTPTLRGLEAKDCIFRIYRDVRFGKDKSPYKTSMGAVIAPGGRKSAMAGYYLHIEPGGCLLAGGSYSPPGDMLKKIRSEIYYNSDEFKEIILAPDFKNYFNELEGAKLVRPPVGFPKDFKDIDLLKFKHYTIFHRFDDSKVGNNDFLMMAINIFEKMNPFIDFLNRALQ